jgi:hypothetical protein
MFCRFASFQPVLNPKKNANPKAPANGKFAIRGVIHAGACPVRPIASDKVSKFTII